MSVTVYSFIMALLWFNVFIIIIAKMGCRNNFIVHFTIAPLLFLTAICFSRLFCIFELPFTVVVPSGYIFPAVRDFLTDPIMFISGEGVAVCLLDLFIFVWATGSIYLTQKYIRLSIVINKAIRAIPETPSQQVARCMNEISYESRSNVKVKVVQSEKVTIPMVVGFFTPTICLPDILFSDAELKDILSHEFRHFLHRDAWVKLFMYLITVVFWWNPFVHILNDNLDHILEIRCDLKVTAKMEAEGKQQYLASILKIIEYKSAVKNQYRYTKSVNASLLISKTSEQKIMQRFNIVLDSQSKKKLRTATIAVYSLILLVFLFSQIFILQPARLYPTDKPGFEGTFTIDLEDSYLKANGEGSYAVYSGGEYIGIVTDITKAPLSSLPVK